MTVRHDCSDEDLIQRLRKRDPEALEILISRYFRELFYFIRLVLDGWQAPHLPLAGLTYGQVGIVVYSS